MAIIIPSQTGSNPIPRRIGATIGITTNVISMKSRIKPKIKITIMVIIIADTLSPGSPVKKLWTNSSPLNPLKTREKTEALIKKIQNPNNEKLVKEKDQASANIEQELIDKLGLKVAISHNKKGKGKLVISYANLTELNEFIAKIN